MDGLLNNPLTHIGLGLLSNSGRSRHPQTGRGVMQGLLSHSAYRQQQQEAEQFAQQQQMAQQKYQMQMEEYQRQQQARAQRDAFIAQATQGMDPRKAALVNLDPGSYIKQQMAAPKAGTDDMREWEMAKTQGYGGTLQDWILSQKKAGATNVSVGGDSDNFAKVMAGDEAKTIVSGYTAATEAADSLTGIHQARQALDRGMVTGAGADLRVGFGKMLMAAGYNQGGNEIENTELFVAATADRTLQKAEKMKGSLSENDMKFLQQASGGDMTLTEGSLRRILDLAEQTTRQQIGRHNRRVDNLKDEFRKQLPGKSYKVDLPDFGGDDGGGEWIPLPGGGSFRMK